MQTPDGYRQLYRATAHLVERARRVESWLIGADTVSQARRLAVERLRSQFPGIRYSLSVVTVCWHCKQPIRPADQVRVNRAGEIRHWDCSFAAAAEDPAPYDADDFDDLDDVPF